MEKHFRANDAHVYLGIGKSTLWYYVAQGLLKPIKLSPRVTIFKKSDLDAFIASRVNEVVA